MAAPVAVSEVAGAVGMRTVLLEGPTVSTPLAIDMVGVMLVVEVPVVRIPVAGLYCGGGILMLKLLGATLVAPAAAAFVVIAILAGNT